MIVNFSSSNCTCLRAKVIPELAPEFILVLKVHLVINMNEEMDNYPTVTFQSNEVN